MDHCTGNRLENVDQVSYQAIGDVEIFTRINFLKFNQACLIYLDKMKLGDHAFKTAL